MADRNRQRIRYGGGLTEDREDSEDQEIGSTSWPCRGLSHDGARHINRMAPHVSRLARAPRYSPYASRGLGGGGRPSSYGSPLRPCERVGCLGIWGGDRANIGPIRGPDLSIGYPPRHD